MKRTPRELIQKLLDAGMTQSQIAISAKIRQSTISKILNGVHSDPRTSTLRKLETLVDSLDINKGA